MAKNLSKLLLPYSFKGFQLGPHHPNEIMILHPIGAKNNLGINIYPTFSTIFTSILTAMCEQDLPYLERNMEARLFEGTKRDLHLLNEKKYKLHYLEPSPTEKDSPDEISDENEEINEKNQKSFHFSSNSNKSKVLYSMNYSYKEKDMKIALEPYGILGAMIDRGLNTSPSVTKIKGRRRTYFINWLSPMDLFMKQILVLNVFYLTQRKLYVMDDEEFLIHGSNDVEKWIAHKWRFERTQGETDWVLTDMDDYLQENPYFMEKK